MDNKNEKKQGLSDGEALTACVAKLLEACFELPEHWQDVWQCSASECIGREPHSNNPEYGIEDTVTTPGGKELPALWLRVGKIPGEENAVLCQRCSAEWRSDAVKAELAKNPRQGWKNAARRVGAICVPLGKVLNAYAGALDRQKNPAYQQAEKRLEKLLGKQVPGGCVRTGQPLTYAEAWVVSKRRLEEVLEEPLSEKAEEAEALQRQKTLASKLLKTICDLEWDCNGVPAVISADQAEAVNTLLRGACVPAKMFLRNIFVKQAEKRAARREEYAEKAQDAWVKLGDLLDR